jgi:hypothetical protein
MSSKPSSSATLLAIGAGGKESRAIFNVASLICFTLGWVALGAQAVRLDPPLTEPKPA